MRGVKDGKEFEKKYISESGCSKKISINEVNSNGYNTFCNDSYLNNKYTMIKTYENGTIVNTSIDEQKKGIGQGKLKSVEITGIKE
ncbi:hypothetical protein CRU99_04540 [Malaciobacter mytili]|uniref:hypothetical protein n=1 Tax=Malaciobacter mytili TaxID=603050 RepID=UPI00100A2A94|nr:hypothetical protein [Malaciobacter mytili]RXI44849.1 hypothetical protein CRU99_04540 [Malaciobacter mytili]